MPLVSGYGTVLGQVVALGGWGLLASVSSGTFADQHHPFVWLVAAALNIALFSIVAVPTYFMLRRRAPRSYAILAVLWLALYVCCLFVLFPATDGP
jgi:hypothetical protein